MPRLAVRLSVSPTEGASVMITCPCGQPHAGAAWDYCLKLAQQLGELVTVHVQRRAFRVPRVYIGMHGLRAEELPALAEKYGWEEKQREDVRRRP